MRLLSLMFAILLLAASPAHAGWKEAKSDHFIVYSKGSESQLRSFTYDLERFDALIRILTNGPKEPAQNRLKVILLNDKDDVQSLVGGNSKYIYGFYTINSYGVMAAVPRSSDSDSKFALTPKTILYHEYVHHYMMQYFPAAYPSWYIEGFAEYYSATEFRGAKQVRVGKLAMSRLPSLANDDPLPLDKLFDQQSRDRKTDGSRFYATAWLLTHYLLMSETRQPEINRYLQAVNAGEDSITAAEKSFTGGLEELDKELRRYWRAKKFYAREITLNSFPETFDISIRELEADKSDSFWLYAAFLRGMDKDQAEDLHKTADKMLADYPQSAWVNWLVAEIQAGLGNNEVAMTLLDKSIDADPGNVNSWLLKAKILMDQAEDDEDDQTYQAARAAIIAANKADVQHPLPLFLNYRLKKNFDKPVTENDFIGLEAAWARLPQNPEYRLTLVAEYMNRELYRQALELIKPVIFDPHRKEDENVTALYEKLLKLVEDEKEETEKDENPGSEGSTG